jgi:hypothetical protein
VCVCVCVCVYLMRLEQVRSAGQEGEEQYQELAKEMECVKEEKQQVDGDVPMCALSLISLARSRTRASSLSLSLSLSLSRARALSLSLTRYCILS